jgi:CTP synthase (UTP-ammonia lyase)
MSASRTPRVAVVGDFNPRNHTHLATNAALGHAGLHFDWIGTERVGDPASSLAGHDGVFVAPASPYRDMKGALGAVRHARERGLPLVGT